MCPYPNGRRIPPLGKLNSSNGLGTLCFLVILQICLRNICAKVPAHVLRVTVDLPAGFYAILPPNVTWLVVIKNCAFLYFLTSFNVRG